MRNTTTRVSGKSSLKGWASLSKSSPGTAASSSGQTCLYSNPAFRSPSKKRSSKCSNRSSVCAYRMAVCG
eukprot:3033758-Pleurochrysis_carterae.AAC.1